MPFSIRVFALGATATITSYHYLRRQCTIHTQSSGKSEPAMFLQEDPSPAFKHRTTPSIIRSLLVFQACQIPWLVDYTPKLISIAKTLHLSSPLFWIIQRSFFQQFCGGETSTEVIPLISKLKQDGIVSILDLSIESDIGDAQADDTQRISRVMELIRDCINTAAHQPGTFVAIKVTALGSLDALENVSGMISYSRDLFKSVQSSDGCINWDQFSTMISNMPGAALVDDQRRKVLFQRADVDKDGRINWTEFSRIINIGSLPALYTGKIDPSSVPRNGRQSVSAKYFPETSSDDFTEISLIEQRLSSLCDFAVEKDVKLMFDAEQSYFQPTIHNRIIPNSPPKAYVYNTYQLYLKEGLFKLRNDFERAVLCDKDYVFAAKLVRGAYMTSERKRAQVLDLSDPINETIEDTHNSYNEAIKYLLKETRSEKAIVVASHNRHSIDLACETLRSIGFDPRKQSNIMFAQLLGMHDHTTYTLARSGYTVAKYVPYGPIEDVIPYLLRRAQENRSVLAGLGSEDLSDRHLLWKELKSRFW